ncbi:MAG: hypothetical protein ABJO27_13365 [Pseudoruegeria sp.]
MSDGKSVERSSEQFGSVTGAIVGHHPLYLDAPRLEPTHRPDQEAGCRQAGFVGRNLDIGKAGQPSGNRRAGKVQLLADLGPGHPIVPAQTPDRTDLKRHGLVGDGARPGRPVLKPRGPKRPKRPVAPCSAL